MKKDWFFPERMIKMILVPLMGIYIPNMTQLVTNSRYTVAQLMTSYAYFIFVSFALWQGNNWLMEFIRNRFVWRREGYYKAILIAYSTTVLYAGVVSALLLGLWKMISKEAPSDWEGVVHTVWVSVIASLLIAGIYENITLNQEREHNLSTVEQLNVAKAQAELEALKNQIDPHFIFNSLNTLSYLITKDPLNARLFNDTLAKVYRYILSNKEKDLVLLKEEIEFISNYFYLIKIRFSDAVNMMIEINDLAAEDFLIPPISLQALVENAIKHNDFNDKVPLGIHVTISSNYVIIKNQINPKNYAVPTSGIGLNNLDNRYKLITKRNIVVENNFKIFSVKLPILKF